MLQQQFGFLGEMYPRFAIASHRPFLRSLLSGELKAKLHGEMVREFSRHSDVSHSVAELVDVSVLFVDALDLDGIFDMLKTVREKSPDCGIVVLHASESDYLPVRLSEHGVAGIVAEGDAMEDIIDAVRAVSRGGMYQSPRTRANLRDKLMVKLTDRERAALPLVCSGCTDSEIAASLKISPSTAESYRKALLRKVGVGDTTALLVAGFRFGIATPQMFDFRRREKRSARV